MAERQAINEWKADVVGRLLAENAQLCNENKRLQNALKDATVHLAGAISAYESFAGNSKRAGVRDACYSTRLSDFAKALNRARDVLS